MYSNNALWSFLYLSSSSNEQVQCCGHGLPLKKFSTYQGIMMAEGKKWLTLQLLLLLFYALLTTGIFGASNSESQQNTRVMQTYQINEAELSH